MVQQPQAHSLCGVFADPAVWQQPNPPHPVTALMILLGPCAGPFAEPLGFVNYSWPRMLGLGAVLMASIGLHPLRPGVGTGVASGIGLVVWYLLGFAITYNEVERSAESAAGTDGGRAAP